MDIKDEEKVVEEKLRDAWHANKWRVVSIVLAVVVIVLVLRSCA